MAKEILFNIDARDQLKKGVEISFATVTPSFVMCGAPNFFSMITLRPFGPRVTFKKGVDALANAVKVTLGPKGRNVIIEKKFGAPHITCQYHV